jgi:hypothetical protein
VDVHIQNGLIEGGFVLKLLVLLFEADTVVGKEPLVGTLLAIAIMVLDTMSHGRARENIAYGQHNQMGEHEFVSKEVFSRDGCTNGVA